MKEIPNSQEAEQALLGSMLIDDSIIPKITLKETDFYESTHQVLFTAIKFNYEKHGLVDIVILRSYLEDKHKLAQTGGIQYIIGLTNAVPTSVNFKSYEGTVKNCSTRRQLISQAKKVENASYEGDEDTIKRELEVLKEDIDLDIKKGYDVTDLSNKFFDLASEYKKYGGMLGYASPFPILDEVVPGMVAGKTYCVCAYSNVGKSNFTYSYVIDSLRKGKKVIFFSLEVQANTLMGRLIQTAHKKTEYEIMQDNFMEEYDIQLFENLTVHDDVYDLTEICSITEQEEPDIIFVDFIQNIETEGFSETDKMDKVSKRLQRLGISTGTIIFNIAQAPNSDEKLPITDIKPKGSGTIFSNTDVIFTLARDGDGLNICTRKNKLGPALQVFDLNVDFPRLQFSVSKKLQENNGGYSNNSKITKI